MNKTFLGIEIGGTKIQVVRGDQDGQIKDTKRFQVDRLRGAKGILEQIREAILGFQDEGHSFDGVGVGFGGPIDPRSGTVICSHHIDGWDGFELGQWLEKMCHCPVTVDNDANVAALGEAMYGAGIGRPSLFYLTLGSGVGGGMIVNHSIYHGAHTTESELGHLRLDRQGTILEDMCSGWSVDRRVMAASQGAPDSILARLSRELSHGQARVLKEALEQGCPIAAKLMEETSEALAFALSHVTHLFHPSCFVIGGGLSLMGACLIDQVSAKLPQWVMRALHPVPAIICAQLGEATVPVGALCLARGA